MKFKTRLLAGAIAAASLFSAGKAFAQTPLLAEPAKNSRPSEALSGRDLSLSSAAFSDRQRLPYPLYSTTYDFTLRSPQVYPLGEIGLLMKVLAVYPEPVDSVTLEFDRLSDSLPLARGTIGSHQPLLVDCPTGPWPRAEVRVYEFYGGDHGAEAGACVFLDDSADLAWRGLMRVGDERPLHGYSIRLDSVGAGFSSPPLINGSFTIHYAGDTARPYVMARIWPPAGLTVRLSSDRSSETYCAIGLYDGRADSKDTVVEVRVIYSTIRFSEAPESSAPSSSALRAWPRPFSQSLTFQFSLPAPGLARLSLYDALGREVRPLAEGFFPAGPATVFFEPSDLPSGIYYAVLSLNGRPTGRLALIHAR